MAVEKAIRAIKTSAQGPAQEMAVFTVGRGGNRPESLTVILSIQDGENFEVIEKPMPDVEKMYEEKRVQWLNNFGVQRKPDKTGSTPKYYIQLPAHRSYVYLYNDEVMPLETTSIDPRTVQAELQLDDPPIGIIR